jgi:hypothetical protein
MEVTLAMAPRDLANSISTRPSQVVEKRLTSITWRHSS